VGERAEKRETRTSDPLDSKVRKSFTQMSFPSLHDSTHLRPTTPMSVTEAISRSFAEICLNILTASPNRPRSLCNSASIPMPGPPPTPIMAPPWVGLACQVQFPTVACISLCNVCIGEFGGPGLKALEAFGFGSES
jgi:hypothetical protein